MRIIYNNKDIIVKYMVPFNKDVVFIYKFDAREDFKYGKIKLSAIPDDCHNLINEIKPIILDVINNNGKTWEVDYYDLLVSIISIMDRNENYLNDNVDDHQFEQYVYSIYIDVRNHESLKYYYDGFLVRIS